MGHGLGKDGWLSDDTVIDRLNKKVADLEQQNLALLAAIEVKDAAIDRLRGALWYQIESKHGPECASKHPEIVKALDAFSISPSPDLLDKRDQKRDAALLRKLSETFRKKENWGIDPVHYLLRLASERESGEWVPELEVKP